MPSIGFQNPISGSYGIGNTPPIINGPGGKPYLGGGITGFVARGVNDTDNNDQYAQIRFTLRNGWNTKYVSQLGERRRIITPFRAVTNSGDILCRTDYSCGGDVQSFQSRPGLNGLRGRFGAIQSRCDGSGIPPSSCNVKYVYDASDYITYLKQKAVNKNYNDYSNAGNNNSGSQSAWRAIRRY
jgi:hypothetical protein